jgi:drug/metabolite transporter (DMT)-like permease
MTSKLVPVIMVIFCGLLGATAQILFKAGCKDLTFSLRLLQNWRLFLGMGLYFVGMLIYLMALRHVDVSRLYPLIAFSYIWAALLAYYFLGERITPSTIVGILLVVAGVSVLTWR